MNRYNCNHRQTFVSDTFVNLYKMAQNKVKAVLMNLYNKYLLYNGLSHHLLQNKEAISHLYTESLAGINVYN